MRAPPGPRLPALPPQPLLAGTGGSSPVRGVGAGVRSFAPEFGVKVTCGGGVAAGRHRGGQPVCWRCLRGQGQGESPPLHPVLPPFWSTLGHAKGASVTDPGSEDFLRRPPPREQRHQPWALGPWASVPPWLQPSPSFSRSVLGPMSSHSVGRGRAWQSRLPRYLFCHLAPGFSFHSLPAAWGFRPLLKQTER